MVNKMENTKAIESYKFVSWDVQSPSYQTMEDYKRISTYNGYDITHGIYSLLGYRYMYCNHLKLFWYRNHGIIDQAYALNITDLKRLLKSRFVIIGKDFKAVEVKQ